MKIVPKLTLALLAGSGFILAGNAYLRVHREIAFFEASRVRDHEMIGRSLSAAVSAIWKAEGEQAARDAVEAVDQQFHRIHIRWRDDASPHAGCEPLPHAGRLATCVVRARPESTWYTYVPIEVAGTRKGELEMTESAVPEHLFTENVLSDTARTTLALALLSALLSFVMGQWLVGRPVRALARKAVRIGHGDFSDPLPVRAKDEIGELAAEMNAMCDRLSTTLEQLRHADRLATVGQLAAGVAHELGTPLNVVTARAGMIESGEVSPAEARDYARAIRAAADRMTKIIRQLMQFARRSGPKKAPSDILDITEQSLELLRPLARKRGVELEVSPVDDVDPVVLVDAGLLQQVVTNLVMNAIHAMPDGGRVTLAFSEREAHPPDDPARPDRRYLCISVRDEGEGIPADSLPHIFEPFFTTKDVGEGTGLGLPVSYGIVRDHGGWIAVESALREGSAFHVYLPRGEA